MSKNTAKLAQAISLLSDVLARDAACESIEDMETAVTDEYDDLKEQAVEFGQEVVDDLSDISNELDRALDLDDENDDDIWNATYAPEADDDDDVGNGEADISDTEPDDDNKNDDDARDGHPNDDDDEADPTADEKVQMLTAAGVILEEKNAELEKNNEELTDKIEDLTDTLRALATQVENLNTTADTFISEVESL